MPGGQILEVAEKYLFDEVRPNAEAIDYDPNELRKALEGLCKLELMALRRPAQYGGPAVPEEDFRRFQDT